MKYILDTNTCIYLIKKNPANVINKFKTLKPGDIGVSIITSAELFYGVFKSSKPNENMVALQEFLAPLIQLEFSIEDALAYGRIRNFLERKGLLIGSMDMLIAAQAISRKLILVTNNLKEFNRINELESENWV